MRIRSFTTTAVLTGVLVLPGGTAARAADPVPRPAGSAAAPAAQLNVTDCVGVLSDQGVLNGYTSTGCLLTADDALSLADCVQYMVFYDVPAVVAQQACTAAKRPSA
ncbi:hypothetical protein AQJ66_29330 [Streptomyces bungoensis]|uniref:Secreted protein n=1 Tax=Streptomyces bungoensis TaxID=285568 RepID=A0A117R9T7_9ACTN|nr:hypothetical protein [Streptomyces bungoensis]KUN78990.1 hypothetical protein AQJ66_29330 [Streptomyces bungoensis]